VVNATLWIVMGGLVVGLLYGLFGVGSAFATPMLSLLGVTGMAAVVGPLPALIPGSAAGAWSYSRQGKVDWRVARAALFGAFPAAILGAITSRWVGGPILLAASGVVLFVVGLRIVRPGNPVAPEVAAWSQRVQEFARAAWSDELRRARVRVEDKGTIVAFHWRGAPDEDAARVLKIDSATLWRKRKKYSL